MTNEQIKALMILEEAARRKSRDSLVSFMQYVKVDYDPQWFHRVIAEKCEKILTGETKKLMIFVPPQHGKSEIVSRKFPAYAFGKNPDLKIAGCSYSADLSEGFSRDIQRTVDSEEYKELFPGTFLNSSNVRSNAKGGFLRTVEKFEIVGHAGFFKAVGVCGALTGNPVDIGIIDDPIKDALEANSETFRERVWDWYLNVFRTRLHNESREIIMMTRWHDDDLAGRLLKLEPGQWEVVSLEAICEEVKDYDPRRIGEVLWGAKHSRERLLSIQRLSAKVFAALYQQKPVIQGGNIVKSDWFRKISIEEFRNIVRTPKINFWLDTAYTKVSSNDPTGIIATCYSAGILYILAAAKVRYEFPELLKWLTEWVKDNGYSFGSAIRIEPKANGKSLVQQLKSGTRLNVMETPTPKDDKETRLNVASTPIEAGKVFTVLGPWNVEFVNEIAKFPNAKHDEYVDLISYAIDHHFNDGDMFISRKN